MFFCILPHTYAKKSWTTYLKFEFKWVSYILSGNPTLQSWGSWNSEMMGWQHADFTGRRERKKLQNCHSCTFSALLCRRQGTGTMVFGDPILTMGSQSSPLYFLWEANWSHSSINSNISRMLSQVPTLALHHEPQDRCRSCPYSVDGLMEKTQVKWVNC